jgi:hypothetical protein
MIKIVEETAGLFRDRVFSPVVTLSAFIFQVLSEDHSCRETVLKVRSDLIAQGKPPCSPGTGGYCQARGRLPKELIYRAVRETGSKLHQESDIEWLWKGRRVVLADGSTVSMPDTPANQKDFPQPKSQEPGIGFPIARLVILTSLASGSVLDCALGPWRGKETGEHALLRQILGSLESDDVLVADRYYCSFFLIAMLGIAGIDFVFQNHTKRKVDFRRGERLGKKDHIVKWLKPVRPEWMDKETYETMPDTLTVRETKVDGRILVSNFLDTGMVTRLDLAELYRMRWTIEIDLKFIKQILKMDVLRGKSPEMVRKEVGVHLLAYNLIRTVMAQAATIHGIAPNTISFKGTVQAMNAFQDKFLYGAEEILATLFDELMCSIVYHRIGDRPGRKEPRAVKRRPKPYPRLTLPRAQARIHM